MPEMFSILYLLLFAFSGLAVARRLFYRNKPLVRIWLGLAFGMLMLIWLPALFSFLFGFVLLSQLLGLATGCAIGIVFWLLSRRKSLTASPWKAELPVLIAGGLLFLLCLVLLSSHTIVERGGALYVGQSTYGDLAMHLGFISSIAVQGTFPPMYSICVDTPGTTHSCPKALGRPSTSLARAFGLQRCCPRRMRFLLVILGVYCFFEGWLREKRKAVFAMLLFFIGGGFGFLVFL
jgi:hypothetical protein